MTKGNSMANIAALLNANNSNSTSENDSASASASAEASSSNALVEKVMAAKLAAKLRASRRKAQQAIEMRAKRQPVPGAKKVVDEQGNVAPELVPSSGAECNPDPTRWDR